MILKFQKCKIDEFIRLAGFVQDNDILTIYGFIKIEIELGYVSLTKHNGGQFIKYEFDSENEYFSGLINYSNLCDYCKSTNKDFIQISFLENDMVELRSGKEKMLSPYTFSNGLVSGEKPISILDFPKYTPAAGFIRIEREEIEAFYSSKDFISDDKLLLKLLSSHYEKGVVFASDRNILFLKKTGIVRNRISLSKKECSLIKDFPYFDFCKFDNYNVIKYQNMEYGFLDIENGEPFDFNFPFEGDLEKFRKEKLSEWIEVNVEELISFCNSVVIFSKGKFTAHSTMYSDGKVNLVFDDRDNSKKFNDEISSIGEHNFIFNFNASKLYTVLSNIPFKKINITYMQNKIYLWSSEDDTFIALCLGLIVQ